MSCLIKVLMNVFLNKLCSFALLAIFAMNSNIGTSQCPAPTIASFSPISGHAGTSVTITGTGFESTPANNIVFFGAVRANVTASTNTSLTVIVPAGTTYESITVTNRCNLTAYSVRPFVLTFPCSETLNSNSFASAIELTTRYLSSENALLLDADGDGKPDLINGDRSMWALRNTSTIGNISFIEDFTFENMWSQYGEYDAVDMDGDGKLDIIIKNRYNVNDRVSIFRNTSVLGDISFAQSIDYLTGNTLFTVAANDIDRDGKPDLIIGYHDIAIVSVCRNTSTSGNISFAPRIDFVIGGNTPGGCYISIGDLDEDGKQDLVISRNPVNSILRNTSTPGNISFEPKIDIVTEPSYPKVAIGDMDEDGKLDLVVANKFSHTISVLRNISVTGTISFEPKIDYSIEGFPVDLAIADLDGDGKIDLAVSSPHMPDYVTALKNNSTIGNISFAAPINYLTGQNPNHISVGDLDGDAKPEIISALESGISIFRNTVGNGNPSVNIQASSTTICAGNLVTFTATSTNGGTAPSFQWQVNGNNVGTNSATYSSNTLNNGDLVRCIINSSTCLTATDTSNVVSLTVHASVIPSVSIAASATTVCTGSIVIFTATPTNGGPAPSYQWKLNGTIVGTDSTIYITNQLTNGDVISCTITNLNSCNPVTIANSNNISMTVLATHVPTVSITASGNDVCAGTPVTLSAIPANTGTPPSYQWKVNESNVGTNSNTFSANSFTDGDKVYCIMHTTTSCPDPPFVHSDTITMIVRPVPAITLHPIDTTILLGSSVQLNAAATGNIASILWTPATGLNNPSILNPAANPVTTTTYHLNVVASNNCISEKTAIIKVFNDIYIPNSFTPNGDAKNDIFRIPPGTPLHLEYFIIYDRYGNEVFKTNDVNKGWDGFYKGMMASNGSYVYVIKGESARGEVFLKGSVLVIR